MRTAWESLRAAISGRSALAIALLILAGACAALGGYLLGHSSAATQAEANRDFGQARREAFERARERAYARALAEGRREGRRTGARAGARAGAERGRKDGQVEIFFTSRGLPQLPSGQSETAPPLAGSGGALVVGDSLEVLTSPYLKQYLPDVPLTVNAVGGYSSIQIFGLFEESYEPSQSVVVFDAGTNDNPSYPEILAGELAKVGQVIGPDRCMVVPTIHGLTVGGVNSEGKNEVVRDFVASRPGTRSPDWAGAVRRYPELMQPDDLHPNPEGADYRARLIARGIKACLRRGVG